MQLSDCLWLQLLKVKVIWLKSSHKLVGFGYICCAKNLWTHDSCDSGFHMNSQKPIGPFAPVCSSCPDHRTRPGQHIVLLAHHIQRPMSHTTKAWVQSMSEFPCRRNRSCSRAIGFANPMAGFSCLRGWTSPLGFFSRARFLCLGVASLAVAPGLMRLLQLRSSAARSPLRASPACDSRGQQETKEIVS